MSIKVVTCALYIAVTTAVLSAGDLSHSAEETIPEILSNLAKSYNSGDSLGFRRDFSDSLLAELSLETVGESFRNFRDSHGKIEKVKIFQISDQGGKALLQFENGQEELHLSLNTEGKVNDLQLLATFDESWGKIENRSYDSLTPVEVIALEDIRQLKELFQKDQGSVRLISILSPT